MFETLIGKSFTYNVFEFPEAKEGMERGPCSQMPLTALDSWISLSSG